MKKQLAIGIVVLFFLSILTPIVFGVNIQISNEIELQTVSSGDGLMNSSWPMFQHDACHTGRSPFGTTGNWFNEKWHIFIGDWAASSPAIDSNGTIYIGGGIHEKKLYAINPNGTLKWSFQTGDLVHSSPAIDENGTVYFGSDDGKLYAIYPNGTKKWSLTIGNGWVYSSPVIDEDGIIYTASVLGHNICAVYKNGTKKWNYKTDNRIYSSPVLDNIGTIYCGSNDGYMYALYKNNGTLKWKYRAEDWCGGAGATVGDDGTIYFGDLKGYLHAVNPNGTRKWRRDLLDNIYSSPAIAEDGSIITGCYRGYIYSFNPDNGSENWKYEVEKYEWIPSSPAIDKYGVIYFGATNGWFYALNPDGTLRWKYKTLDEIFTSAAIDEDGTIYIAAHCISQPDFYAYLYALEPIDNNAPDIPIINGPNKGTYQILYNYTTESNDMDGDNISYFFNWGDGTNSGWTNYVVSGTSVELSHSWQNVGIYTVKVKVKDDYGMESSWCELEVNMPRNKAITSSLLLWLLERFPNVLPILKYLQGII